MRKLFLLFGLLLTVTACSLDGDKQDFHLEYVPIVGVDMPDYFVRGETYYIPVHYRVPNDCYAVPSFYYEHDGNTRIVAVQTVVSDLGGCKPISQAAEPLTITLEFLCAPGLINETYLFKFYAGLDDEGNEQYLEIEVPVEQ